MFGMVLHTPLQSYYDSICYYNTDANTTNSRSQIFLKQVFLKILQYSIHRKAPVLESLFEKNLGLTTYIFVEKRL